MNRLSRFLLASVALGFASLPFSIVDCATVASAQTVWVRGYTTRSGTVVAPHERRHPLAGSSVTKSAESASTPCWTCSRDKKGRIARSESAKAAFKRFTGFPSGRPGWVIDHIVPLACGGADLPSNMQWQTAAEARHKDRFERKGCTVL